MRFCWVCNNAVEDGKRVTDCEMCEGAIASVIVHPREDVLRKHEITKLRRLYTQAEKEADKSAEAKRQCEIIAGKLLELGVVV